MFWVLEKMSCGSFEYPQQVFWLRNKKNNLGLCTLICRPVLLMARASSTGSGNPAHPHNLACLCCLFVRKSLDINVLSCQTKVTVTSCFVNKVIMDLELIDHLCINPICRIRLIHK